MSEIRVTSIVGENGGDRVGLTTGLTVGPLTGTTGIGATITHQGHAQFAGVCTATEYRGGGNSGLIINSSGAVTKPSNPCFRARASSGGWKSFLVILVLILCHLMLKTLILEVIIILAPINLLFP